MKLVLFDIDGTLVLTDGAGKRAVHRALIEVFGTTGPTDHRFDGKTDPQIIRELMRHEGHEDEHIDARMERLLELYVGYLREEVRDPAYAPRVLPGVHPLLDAIEARAARGEAVPGLLTGNLLEGARVKLEGLGIDFDRFVVGAYGSDHEARAELPAVAQRRARERLGVDIPGHDVVVIGDTPNDMTCGRAIGARAIGVATGWYSTAELARHGAAAVFEDLSDTDAVMEAIMRDVSQAPPEANG